MSAILFKFTITNGRESSVRKIIAHSTFEATCTGIRTSSFIAGPVKIVCKPAERIRA